MKAEFLGDSFDIVKRFWAERLTSVAPLFAHPMFVPPEIRSAFERTVGIPIFDPATRNASFGLFFDPDTGIPLPTSGATTPNRKHAPLQFIVSEIERVKPAYVICFDQSHDRNCGQLKQQQRQAKLAALGQQGVYGAYYVSHAPFLFAARDDAALTLIISRLVDAGIPAVRFERCGSST